MTGEGVRGRLRREVVVRAALTLLDEVGIDGLTTRRLARELGVQSPALYWHVKNKRELLDLMAAAMHADTFAGERAPRDVPWTRWLAEDAQAKRRALLSHRDGARVEAGSRPTPAQLPGLEAQLQALCAAGFTPRDALRACLAVDRYTMGWVLEEQAATADAGHGAHPQYPDEVFADLPLLAQGAAVLRQDDPDADFDYGLRVLIAGIEAALEAPAP